MAGERVAEGLAGAGVPQPQRGVTTTGDDAAPVGAKRHTEDGVGVAGERLPEGLAGVGVPQSDRVVPTAGDDAAPVGAEPHTLPVIVFGITALMSVTPTVAARVKQ